MDTTLDTISRQDLHAALVEIGYLHESKSRQIDSHDHWKMDHLQRALARRGLRIVKA